MKKRRIKADNVPEEVYLVVLDNAARIFLFLEDLGIAVPSSALFMLLCLKLTENKFDIRFYKDQNDFLLDYTSCLLKNREDYEFHSFNYEEEVESWDLFLPPPVVGLNLQTRLRSGLSF